MPRIVVGNLQIAELCLAGLPCWLGWGFLVAVGFVILFILQAFFW
jgi:hypothetical protein